MTQSNVTMFGDVVAPTPVDPGQMLRHLQLLHGRGDGRSDIVISFLSQFEKARQQNLPGSDFDGMTGVADVVQPMVDAGWGVYVSVNRFDSARVLSQHGNATRHKKDVVAVSGVVIDLDVKPGAFASSDEVWQLLGALPLPTLVVGSGSGGAHAYWLLDVPSGDVERAHRLGLGWHECVTQEAVRLLGRSVQIDAVSDLSRVLRLAGTWRHPKRGETAGPAPVTLMWDQGPLYELGYLESLVPGEVLAGAREKPAPVAARSPGSAGPDAGWVGNLLRKTVTELAQRGAGERNAALNRAAYTLGGVGAHGWLEMEQAYELLVLGACVQNGLVDADGLEQCRATFESGWVSGLADPIVPPVRRDGGEGVGSDDEWPSPFAPVDVAERLFGLWGPFVRHWRGEWHRHLEASHRWEPAEDAAVRSAVYGALHKARYVNDKGEEVRWLPTTSKVNQVLDAMAAVRHLGMGVEQPSWLPDSPSAADGLSARDLMVCENGILHVPSRTLGPHDPWLFNQVVTTAVYRPGARALAWERFLETVWPDDPDQALLLAEWFGYVLSGETRAQKMALLVGPPRSGKGTIANVLTALMGNQTVSRTLRNFTESFGLQPLLGQPLCIIGDARLSGDTKPVVEQLLTISGGDVVTVERKHRASVSVRLPTRFMLLSNELPAFNDPSGAIASRFVLMQLNESFIGREDLDLGGRLAGELSGVLDWALDGLDRLRGNGWRFTVPQSSRQSMQDMADAASPVSVFVREMCVLGPQHEVDRDSLYAAWVVWSARNGHNSLSKIVFGRNLSSAEPTVQRRQPRAGDGSRANVYGGIALVAPAILPAQG